MTTIPGTQITNFTFDYHNTDTGQWTSYQTPYSDKKRWNYENVPVGVKLVQVKVADAVINISAPFTNQAPMSQTITDLDYGFFLYKQ